MYLLGVNEYLLFLCRMNVLGEENILKLSSSSILSWPYFWFIKVKFIFWNVILLSCLQLLACKIAVEILALDSHGHKRRLPVPWTEIRNAVRHYAKEVSPRSDLCIWSKLLTFWCNFIIASQVNIHYLRPRAGLVSMVKVRI